MRRGDGRPFTLTRLLGRVCVSQCRSRATGQRSEVSLYVSLVPLLLASTSTSSLPLQAPGTRPPGIALRLDEHEGPPPPPKSFLQRYVSP